MKLLKINDNSTEAKEKCEQEIPQIVKKVANLTLAQLSKEGVFVFPEVVKDSPDLEDKQMILKSVDDKYYTGNVMGFLGCNDERLVISSRFSNEKNDFFLQYMLSKVLDFPNTFDMNIEAGSDKKVIDLLTFLFPSFLKSAMKKGLFKTYIRVNYNDSNPKGTIDIAKHIKQNVPFLGKIAYSQREYSYDNYLMELVRHTIEFIKTKPYGKAILNGIKDEVKCVVEATPKYQFYDRHKIIMENKKTILRHAYYHEYRSLQSLCIYILQNTKLGLGLKNHNVNGILFDGAWLWEEYINTTIGKWFYHPKNKQGEGAHNLFQNGNGRIYPDFIGKDSDCRVIADAKYKPSDNISNDDYYQVLAYMMRFDSKKGFYLYPESDENEESKELKLQSGSKYDKTQVIERETPISIIKHGFKIPKESENYNAFCEQMEKSETEFIKIFKQATN